MRRGEEVSEFALSKSSSARKPGDRSPHVLSPHFPAFPGRLRAFQGFATRFRLGPIKAEFEFAVLVDFLQEARRGK
jgi:hypothetical protein